MDRRWLAALLQLAGVSTAHGVNNGLYWESPPMGWRSWNAFGFEITQDKMELSARAMTQARKGADGSYASLAHLGYVNVGLDDNWQQCGAGAGGTFHDASGRPLVNTNRFPDMTAMVRKIHENKLKAGWYLNNCKCAEMTSPISDVTVIKGDVQAITRYGFDSVKLDGCGRYMDVRMYKAELNATGRPVMIENCHWGKCTDAWRQACPEKKADGSIRCPMHFFRTSGDIDATEYSWLRNLETAVRFLDREAPLAGRGCWSYPDMLEVGNLEAPHNTLEWAQAHFASWCVTSSPLILGFDVRDESKLAEIWGVVANPEAIAVNQRWAGHPGFRLRSWTPAGAKQIDGLPTQKWQRTDNLYHSSGWLNTMQIWVKPQPNASAAVLILNAGTAAASYELNLADIGLPQRVRSRDIWEREDMADVQAKAEGTVRAHACVFLLLQPLPPLPRPPPPMPSPTPPQCSPPVQAPLPPKVSASPATTSSGSPPPPVSPPLPIPFTSLLWTLSPPSPAAFLSEHSINVVGVIVFVSSILAACVLCTLQTLQHVDGRRTRDHAANRHGRNRTDGRATSGRKRSKKGGERVAPARQPRSGQRAGHSGNREPEELDALTVDWE